MSDSITKVTHIGLGKKFTNSIKGIFLGLLLFFGSFVAIYLNEGRVNMANIARTAVEIEATETVDAELNGQLVSTTGEALTTETIGDDLYLKPGNYISVHRTVEMYAWEERSETKTEEHLGGSETQTTTYTYHKGWSQLPADSSTFEEPLGHENPQKLTDSESYTVGTAKIGNFDLDMRELSLPGHKDLVLDDEMLDLTSVRNASVASDDTASVTDAVVEGFSFSSDSADVEVSTGETAEEDNGESAKLGSNYVYIGYGSIATPDIGDLRISYSVVPNNINATVFARQNGQSLTKYYDEATDTTLYRMFEGSRASAIKQMQFEYKMMLWVFRIVGFLMMWTGLAMLFGPIVTLMGVVPAFGDISGFLVKVATFVVALVLSIVTVIIAMILHSWLAILIIALAGIAGVAAYLKLKGKKK